MIFDTAGVQPELQPTNEREYRTPARRPKYSALANVKLDRSGVAPMPGLQEALNEYFRIRNGG